ncbi:hypothetical protein K2173_019459 [Erythroxylum novogranatense]|uniref:Beta-galactosidase n=1 Tax=Erythroxylum novogranatense TaxID=1862640 RepID=A0AAV8UBE5_9ROSI|nr:hypothetical protein K2173_019459 [Erythroxylum novogranatense]
MGTMNSFSAFCATLLLFISVCSAYEVTYDNRAIVIDGERKLIISGAIHYPRSTPKMWPSLMKKSKEGGLNTIETYVFWNHHEPQRRQYDFSGHLDVVRFIKTIKDAGLYAILRIGPYVCAEWTYGGIPVWLHNIPGIKMRTNNEIFKKEMQTFVTLIVEMMKKHRLFASQGGPIIMAQIENEYGNVEWAYKDDGWKYVEWCANLAKGYKLDVPWIMCQQDNAPEGILSACNGYYCDWWDSPKNNTPKMWTENWSGWYKNWGSQDPHRTAEDLAFSVARFFQRSGTVQNYYMYHGGTNFDTSAGGPYITTSYDYDAPLDEYGNLNQPKWGHLRDLHLLLYSMEANLVYGERESLDQGGGRYITIFSHEGKRSCFLSNPDQNDAHVFDFEGNQYNVPAWSVTILPDCYTEVYNTAKVNSQTSVMVKKPNAADDFEEPYKLKWSWRTEKFIQLNKLSAIKGSLMTSNCLLDQKRATNGTSDYLWLMTKFEYNQDAPYWKSLDHFVLQVHTHGHVVHGFVNGEHFGTQWALNGKFEFTFEKVINLVNGTNYISLISTTVGLQNYGQFYDEGKNGIRGPVKLIRRPKEGLEGAVEHDLSVNEWVYKTGLDGVDIGTHKLGSNLEWTEDSRPANKPFIWYKTTFKAPTGEDPVVVDLLGLGKGMAWVNGHSIGRYWPSYMTSEDGCIGECDYRGKYNPSKCRTNCGKSSQRWYHIPRSFLNADDNELVLFEEFGGTPDLVSVETVTVGTVCANAYEHNTLELSCQGGKVFKDIKFASFGLPRGICGDFHLDRKCHAKSSLEVVQNACIGNEKCSLKVAEATFAPLRCNADQYRLAVEAICGDI